MGRDLTPTQRYELIDFLKRWGIDHPELLAEMTDHYTEKALEAMASGNTFEGTLDSWKTKETFRSLRKIQHDYENVFPAKVRRQQWAVVKAILLNARNIGLLAILLMALFALRELPFGSMVLTGMFLLLCAFFIGVLLYAFLFHRVRQIISFRNFGFYYIINVLFVQIASNQIDEAAFWNWNELPVNNIGVIVVWAMIVLNVITFRLWQHAKTETAHLTDQMLKEHIPARYE